MNNYDLWKKFRELVNKHNVIFKFSNPKTNSFIRDAKSLSRKIAFNKNTEMAKDMKDELAPFLA